MFRAEGLFQVKVLEMAQNGNSYVWGDMKTIQALNFFLIGSVMSFSPAYWPEYFTSELNNSELWLLFMGATQMILGGWVMVLNEVPRLLQAVAQWEPVTVNFALPDVGWSLPESFYAGMNSDDDIRVALNLQQQLRMPAAA